MRFDLVITVLACPIIFALHDELIDSAVSYFKDKHTFFVCVLTCDSYTHKLAKVAKHNNLAISSVKIIGSEERDEREIDLCLSHTSPNIGVLINSTCPLFERILTYASQNNLLDSKHKWVIMCEKTDPEDVGERSNCSEPSRDINVPLLSTLSNLNLTIDADIVVSVNTGVGRYCLYDVYNFGKQRNGRFVVEVIGDWNNVTGLLNLTTLHKYYRRFDFHGIILKLVFVMSKIPIVFDPQMVLNWNPDPSVSILTHTGFIFLHEVAEVHNIRFNYTIFDIWVGDYNKGHTSAVTNSLYFQDQDVTPVLRLLPTHVDKFDVTFPVSHVETRYFYKIPSHGIGKFENQFLTPLSPSTWWCFLGISVLCGIVLLLAAIRERRPTSLPYALFSILALICQQFLEEHEPQRVSSVRKLVMLVTGVFCLLIYNYYTSSVVSWLLNAPPPSINSLWDLLDSPLQPILEDTGYTYSWLQLKDYYYNKKYAKAEDELKKRLLNLKKRGKPIFKLVRDGIAMVKEGGYVYHVEVDSANKIIARTFDQRELCDLGSLRSLERELLFIAVQKNSPYKEFFVWSPLRLLEAGVLKRVQLRTWGHANRCEGSSSRALALGGAAPAFIVLLGGYLVAVAIVLAERFVCLVISPMVLDHVTHLFGSGFLRILFHLLLK